MSMFFRNWLEEGYYEEDSLGDLTRLEKLDDILEAKRKGRLYENDGMCTTKVSEDGQLNLHKKYES